MGRVYSVYLGTCEQFKYTFKAANLADLRTQISNAWPSYHGRWFKQDASGCPNGAKRFYVNNVASRPVLIIPEK